MSGWPWLGGRKLNEVISMSMEHLETVLKTTHTLKDLIDALEKGDLSKADEIYEKISSCERKADDIKRNILQNLRGSYIHPQDREDILRLIMTADDIAAFAKSSAKRFMNIYHIGLRIPDNVFKDIGEIIDKTVTATDLLLESIRSLGTDPSKSVSLTHEVEKIEEEIDDIRLNVLEKVYSSCVEKVEITCILIKDLVDDLESISDKCEDTGDVIRLIALTT